MKKSKFVFYILLRLTLIIFIIFYHLQLVGQECINPKFLENDLTFSYYNKKGKKDRLVNYNILKIKNSYLFKITDLNKEMSSFDIKMSCNQTHMDFGGDFNLILYNPNLINSMDLTLDGHIEYPKLHISKLGLDLAKLELIAEFKTEGDLMQGKVSSHSTSRKITDFQSFMTTFGRLYTLVIETQTKTKFESNVINMNFVGSSKEFFSPELGLPIRSESYNKRGKLIGYSQLNGSYLMKRRNNDDHCGITVKNVTEHKHQPTKKTCWFSSLEMVLGSDKCISISDSIELTKEGGIELSSEGGLETNSSNIEKLGSSVGLNHVGGIEPLSGEALYDLLQESDSALWLASSVNHRLYRANAENKSSNHALVMHGAEKDCETGKITVDIYDPWFDSASNEADYKIDLDQFLEYVNVYDVLFR